MDLGDLGESSPMMVSSSRLLDTPTPGRTSDHPDQVRDLTQVRLDQSRRSLLYRVRGKGSTGSCRRQT